MASRHQYQVQVQHERGEAQEVQQAGDRNHAHPEVSKLLTEAEAFEELSEAHEIAHVTDETRGYHRRRCR